MFALFILGLLELYLRPRGGLEDFGLTEVIGKTSTLVVLREGRSSYFKRWYPEYARQDKTNMHARKPNT